MELEEAIRTRRTHKVFGAEPVPREELEAILDLARWAPNHHLTNPWRFRVLGPESLVRLKEATGPEAASKLDRAPTLVAISALRVPDDPAQDEEDVCAAACAAYIVLLAAHDRGLAAYWRTPAVLREPAGRAALGIPDSERPLGLLHLGSKRQEGPAPARAPLAEVVEFLA